jgi:hypothetical protein
MPLRFAATRGARELLARPNDGRLVNWRRLGPVRLIHLRRRLFQKLGERHARDAPLAADALPFQIAGLEAGDDVRFGDAEALAASAGPSVSGMPAAADGGAPAAGVVCAERPPA